MMPESVGLRTNPPIYFGVDFFMRMQVERRHLAGILVDEFSKTHASRWAEDVCSGH